MQPLSAKQAWRFPAYRDGFRRPPRLGTIAFTCCTLTIAAAQAASEAREIAAVPFDWQITAPESQGLSRAKLDALKASLAARRTRAFLLVHDDRIVYEWYAPGHSATKPHFTASMAKALVGGVSLGVALSDGRIGLDTVVARDLVPQWQDDLVKSQITIRQLGSHTSGIADAEQKGVAHGALSGWKGDFWKRRDPPHDPFTVSRDLAPAQFPPGEARQYSNPGIAMLTYAVTAALRDAPEKDIRTLLRDRIMRAIGVADDAWSCGYGTTVTVDGLPLVASWGGGSFTARAAARVGRLMLREGNWEGRQLLSAGAVRQITTDAATPGPGAMGWWSNRDGFVPALPRDAFWGAGAQGQVLLVVPSLKLIAVRNGGALDAGDNDRALERHVFGPLMEALPPPGAAAAVAPARTERVIEEISWAPQSTIVRRARGSDNWPLTWGEDDALYTAYGDG